MVLGTALETRTKTLEKNIAEELQGQNGKMKNWVYQRDCMRGGSGICGREVSEEEEDEINTCICAWRERKTA